MNGTSSILMKIISFIFGALAALITVKLSISIYALIAAVNDGMFTGGDEQVLGRLIGSNIITPLVIALVLGFISRLLWRKASNESNDLTFFEKLKVTLQLLTNRSS